MKSFIVLLFLLLLRNSQAAPPRPQISEIFQTTSSFQYKISHGPTVQGIAVSAVNQPNGMGMEQWSSNTFPNLDTFVLQRFDLNAIFELDGQSPTACEVHKVDGSMPKWWGWLQYAEFIGQQNFSGMIGNVWETKKGYSTVQLGVSTSNPNIPLWLTRNSNSRELNLVFTVWNTSTPEQNIFTIPSLCKPNHTYPQHQPNKVGCVDRNTMIQRAQVWVNARVPYNQQEYYDGYREDCSGYVSMSWSLPKPGLTTKNLASVSTRITKNELQPGDILLNAAEHVVIFGGWTESSKDHYTAFEETKPGEGTVKRTTPYPYWYNTAAFLPYRFNSVC